MTTRPPEFDDLVGPEVDAAERDRLRRVHDLLVDVGPPPELSQTSAPAIGGAPVTPLRRPSRRRRVVLALAAALGVVAIFTLGLVVAAGDDPDAERVVAMTGASGATASLEIFEIDAAGNWPMLIDVARPPARPRRPALRALADEGRTADGSLRELPHRRRGSRGRPDERPVAARRLRRLGRRRARLG